jgi:hypothetical protein
MKLQMVIGESTIEAVEVVQSLGMWFDSHMSMDIHIGKVCIVRHFAASIISGR